VEIEDGDLDGGGDDVPVDAGEIASTDFSLPFFLEKTAISDLG
jgi:hypothetical protein